MSGLIIGCKFDLNNEVYFAATGEKGRVYEISPFVDRNGKTSIMYNISFPKHTEYCKEADLLAASEVEKDGKDKYNHTDYKPVISTDPAGRKLDLLEIECNRRRRRIDELEIQQAYDNQQIVKFTAERSALALKLSQCNQTIANLEGQLKSKDLQLATCHENQDMISLRNGELEREATKFKQQVSLLQAQLKVLENRLHSCGISQEKLNVLSLAIEGHQNAIRELETRNKELEHKIREGQTLEANANILIARLRSENDNAIQARDKWNLLCCNWEERYSKLDDRTEKLSSRNHDLESWLNNYQKNFTELTIKNAKLEDELKDRKTMALKQATTKCNLENEIKNLKGELEQWKTKYKLRQQGQGQSFDYAQKQIAELQNELEEKKQALAMKQSTFDQWPQVGARALIDKLNEENCQLKEQLNANVIAWRDLNARYNGNKSRYDQMVSQHSGLIKENKAMYDLIDNFLMGKASTQDLADKVNKNLVLYVKE